MCRVGEGVDRPKGRVNLRVDMGRPIVTEVEFVALVCENV